METFDVLIFDVILDFQCSFFDFQWSDFWRSDPFPNIDRMGSIAHLKTRRWRLIYAKKNILKLFLLLIEIQLA